MLVLGVLLMSFVLTVVWVLGWCWVDVGVVMGAVLVQVSMCMLVLMLMVMLVMLVLCWCWC